MKRNSSVILAVIMAVTLAFSGCGKNSADKAANTGAENPGTEQSSSSGLDEGGVTNKEGYPITSEPVTIKAAVSYNSIRPDMGDSNIWKYVADKTNINFEIETIKDSDKVDLMFASDDLPDLLMGVNITANQMTGAAEGGSFVEMEPLLKDYAPTWYKFMQDNRLVYNASLATDGKLYGLPYIDFSPFDRNLRDQWIIMKNWLDELNLSVPKTTKEFENVLQAIKDNAGKGSIPQDVIPYYFLFDSYVGGQFDIYGSYGVYVTSDDYVYVDKGVVKDQSTNPAIKEPLKFLKELYSKGLIPPEVFTDDWNTYVSKISSNPAIVGSYTSYANRQMDQAAPMGPLDTENGSTPLMRSQAFTPGPANVAIITKNNKYPAATARFLEALASDTEMMLTVSRGTKGIVWDNDSDGKAYPIFWEEAPDKMQENSKDLGMNNSFAALKDSNFYDKVWKETSYDQLNSRAWAYENVYKNSVMPNDMVYVSGTLGTDDTNALNIYKTDLANYRKSMFADFITGKRDIDKEWDSYVKEMNKLGLEEFIKLKQKGYDLMVK
ncbi:hypothetical protein SAMN02745136_00850 [Anaerocolumna jejuensis DSM 15929]|uniref:Aldouronate transport system substrate-binding protein n=1 Tax=Anaerocolumna jejuensis DSM 15929 TaxID=1121322 RepID=A0A1M6M5C7_9FIRM|nr:hypothetical protein [Anaerocolumna jejuensis]SHJ78637.1 hypothetical protein SAMN02745136_00850 [Anaerocolumna jejuensis DSM 15929]